MLRAVVAAQEALISGVALHVFINVGGAHGFVCDDLLFSSRSGFSDLGCMRVLAGEWTSLARYFA